MRRGALGLATAACSTLVLVGGLTSSPASAGTVFAMPATGTVALVGHGYGHGHGMSQHGAQGAATGSATGTKLTWAQILGFYYPGTAQASLVKDIRVKITADTTRDVVVEPRAGLAVTNTATGETRELPANGATQWRLGVVKGNRTAVAFKKGSARWKRFWAFDGDGAFGAGGEPIRLFYPGASRLYRGRLVAARPSAGSTDRDTINQLSLENYLRGVVPAEMPATWHVDAVSAQAVAARTYAAYLLQRPQASFYDICDTTSCQVYGGYSSEHPNANAAIDATAGVILTYGGKPAFTQFSASSGGFTDGGSVPYLDDHEDPYDDWKRADGSPGNASHNWTKDLDVATIEKAFPAVGDLTSIEVVSRDGHGEWGGRVLKLRLTGTKNGAPTVVDNVGGSDFRMRLGLKSTWFTFPGVPARTR